jgi:tetratricopeptide (TPR) repeat protein
MIVRDEAAHLADCLDSVRGLCDEVVVVDTGSRDTTADIARQRGAKVFSSPWTDDFAAARNASIAHAKGDWIFWLDADDRVIADTLPQLARLFRGLPEGDVGYLMRVLSPGPDGGPMFDTWHVRLFPNKPHIRWEGRVHEQIGGPVQRAGGTLSTTDISILHTGYRSPSSVTAKLTRNLRILDAELATAPLNATLLTSRAATLVDLGRPTEALVSLHLCAVAYGQSDMPPHLGALFGRTNAMLGDLTEALECVRSSLLRHPCDSKLLFMEAELLGALGDYEGAEASIRGQMLVGEEYEPFACADRTIAGFRARHFLCQLLLFLGRYQEAEAQAQLVIRARPSYAPAWLSLAESLFAQGRFAQAEFIKRKFQASPGLRAGEDAFVTLSHYARRAYLAGLSVAEQALAAHPSAPALLRARMRCLAGVDARPGDLDAAVHAALEADPTCLWAWALRRRLAAALPVARQTMAELALTSMAPLVAY